MQGCCKLPFCRLRRLEGRMQRGHLALRQRAVALSTPTSMRGIPNLATALDHNETCWYSTTYTLHKVQKYYALASEAGTFPGRDAIMQMNQINRLAEQSATGRYIGAGRDTSGPTSPSSFIWLIGVYPKWPRKGFHKRQMKLDGLLRMARLFRSST
jgi:hypothetical protein